MYARLHSLTLRRYHLEKSHFQKLSLAAQKLLVSVTIYDFAYPLIFTFINAFIFRQTNDVTAVALYNLATFITLPFAFWSNGLLLKKFPIHYVLSGGLIGQGFVASMVFFFPFNTLTSLVIFGGLQGFPLGYYWANRNFITLAVTKDENRNYFTGLEAMIGMLTGIITPFLLGLIIRAGEYTSTYEAEPAYRVLSIVALVLLAFGGWVFLSAPVQNPNFKKLFIFGATSKWSYARLQEICIGYNTGMSFFLPALITFTLIGKEGSLGAIQSGAALVTASTMYGIARKAKPHHRLLLIKIAILLLLSISSLFLLFFNQVTAILYLLLVSFTAHLIWISANPITLRVIDEEESGDATNNYAYVCDRELYLNIGRIAGVFSFLALTYHFSDLVALRFIPVLMGLFQVGVWWTARQLVQTSSRSN
ncbi:MAG TPA: MFS transporter [Patescibacteria group bacterium]